MQIYIILCNCWTVKKNILLKDPSVKLRKITFYSVFLCKINYFYVKLCNYFKIEKIYFGKASQYNYVKIRFILYFYVKLFKFM